MYNKNYTFLLEDSIGNKYYFFYKDYSIFYNEIKCTKEEKETLLINAVQNKFLATIDAENTLYVVCYSKNKSVVMFSFKDNNWKMEEILNVPENMNIVLMDILIVDSNIHVIYATQLPVSNFYNIYHMLFKDSMWTKNNISEIYCANLDKSYSSTVTTDNVIHFINVGYDGKKYMLIDNYYDNDNSKWISQNVVSLNNDNITLQLLCNNVNDEIHLLCHTNEENTSIIFYFIKKLKVSNEFEFICLSKIIKDTSNVNPIFFIYNTKIFAAWIADAIYNEYSLNIQSNEWELSIQVPIRHIEENIDLVQFIKNNDSNFIFNKQSSFVDDKFNIINPYTLEFNGTDGKQNMFELAKENEEINKQKKDYIPYLADQMKILSATIKSLNSKLNELDNNTSNNSIQNNYFKQKVKAASYKHTNFKQNFLSDHSITRKLDSDFSSKLENENNFKSVNKTNNSFSIFKEQFMKGNTNNLNPQSIAYTNQNNSSTYAKNQVFTKSTPNNIPNALENSTDSLMKNTGTSSEIYYDNLTQVTLLNEVNSSKDDLKLDTEPHIIMEKQSPIVETSTDKVIDLEETERRVIRDKDINADYDSTNGDDKRTYSIFKKIGDIFK